MLPLLTSFIPSAVNAYSQMMTNSDNRSFYQATQHQANEFARSERLAAQEYNSPLNQLSLMQQAGMNPNLLSGTMFQATSPVPNQSVSPPQSIAPTLPSETLSQSGLNFSSAKDLQSQQISRDALLDGLVKTQNVTVDWIVQQKTESNERISQIQKNIEVMNETISSIKESILNSRAQRRLYDEQSKGQEIQNSWLPKINDTQIKKFVSDMRVNDAQRSFLYANAQQLKEMSRALWLQNDINYKNRWFTLQIPRLEYQKQNAAVIRAKVENNRLRFDFGKQKQYYDIDKAVQYLNVGLDLLDWSFSNSPWMKNFEMGKSLLPWIKDSSSQ